MSDPLIDCEAVLGDLKEFQRRTAEWVFTRMFDPSDPSYRFLVADEVGLGKTHVAKGVIAQLIDHLQRIGEERHDIVYVCSNAAIARQNVRKLVPPGIVSAESVERLTMLPLVDLDANGEERPPVNLLPITPGTSLAFGRNTGRFMERVLAYSFLRELWGAPAFPRRARWIFWEGVGPSTGDNRLRDRSHDYRRSIRPHVEAFEAELTHLDTQRRRHHRPTTREAFDELVEGLAWQRTFPEELQNLRGELIGDLRRVMATVGIGLLNPDLVILDEFQRFKDLLDPDGDTWAADLANRLFTHRSPATGRPTRTLLLSATPYRMYTLPDEETDDHYADFFSTCSFLMDDERVRATEQRFRALRVALTDPDSAASAGEVCGEIRDKLRKVMARTERLAVTPDRAGMLADVCVDAPLEEIDLRAYVRLGDLADRVGGSEPTEYWKSSPYLFNFMEGYQLKRALEAAVDEHRLPANERLDAGPGLLDWDAVDAYQQVDAQNGRLRWLLDDLEGHGAFDLLWIPPSLPYYTAGSVYERTASASLTKRLVFSGWTVVPKVVSTLLSYEAERRAFIGHSMLYTTDYGARGGRRLDFDLEDGRPAAMTAFVFVWPSPTLAELGNPRTRSGPNATLASLLADVRARVAEELRPLTAGRPEGAIPDRRWYWAAPLLLDQRRHPSVTNDWFGGQGSDTHWVSDSPAGFARHAQVARELLSGSAEPLGRVPNDLDEVLAELAVRGPAICTLRALAVVIGLPLTDASVLTAAAHTAWGFRSLFNAPDTTALVQAQEPLQGSPYWRAAVRHSGSGNLQALLDEHVHVLRDWLGHLRLTGHSQRTAAATEISDKLSEALSLRTSSFRVDVPHIEDGLLRLDERRMRTRFATPFGNQRLADGGEARVESVLAAFNSPFWPFVLTSTSIGQEGLDFHLWCHAVVHWNLPSNPVDLEQREGRVHRFKGHVVRRNLAAALGEEVLGNDRDPWDALFYMATEARSETESEVVPHWIYNHGEARIQRLAPVLPYSRDAAMLPKLRRSLAAYRLAIGQPRQQELLEYLDSAFDEHQLAELADQLRIDLNPPA